MDKKNKKEEEKVILYNAGDLVWIENEVKFEVELEKLKKINEKKSESEQKKGEEEIDKWSKTFEPYHLVKIK